jgi:hypothetical protein
VAEERCFALKGGTAINLFVRDLPRLSVDDLTYVPVRDRRPAWPKPARHWNASRYPSNDNRKISAWIGRVLRRSSN